MKCPMCSAKAKDGAAECPSCGAIFAKLLQRKEREKNEAAAALAKLAAVSEPPVFNPWTGRVIAVAIVLFWTIGLAFYYRVHFSRPPQDRPPVPVSEVTSGFIRDPATGRMKRVEIRKAPSALVRPNERRDPAPSSGQGPQPQGGPAYDPDFDD